MIESVLNCGGSNNKGNVELLLYSDRKHCSTEKASVPHAGLFYHGQHAHVLHGPFTLEANVNELKGTKTESLTVSLIMLWVR